MNNFFKKGSEWRKWDLISASEIIVLVCAFGMDMQIPLSPL
jgi:hypothetical protein